MSERKLVTVTIDGRTVQVPEGTNLVLAAQQAGIEIPVFCYHPKLDPAGLCRMCLVQIEKQPKPTTACTTYVTDGMVVHTQNELVANLRKGVLEFLLLNHPLDCPVCDKGGECDLQDLTFAYGSGVSRLTLPKEHKPKAVNLGPFIVLDEERCILCRRCVRYDAEVAQEGQLVVEERGHRNLITTLTGAAYDHYFTGNVIDLCPVGALTSDLYRFKARPWDLSRAQGVCAGCSVGCSVELHFRHGQFLRVVPGDNPETDGGWICDRGRFNYQYVHSEGRITQPLVRRDGRLVSVSWAEALDEAARRLKEIRDRHGAEAIGLVGGGRLTLEEAYAFQRLGRAVLGTDNIDSRVGGQVTASLAGLSGRLADLDEADLYLVVDCLPADQMPAADIRIRRGLGRRRAKLVAVGAALPSYRAATLRIPCLPGQTAQVLAAVVAHLSGQRAAVPAGVDGEAVAALAELLRKAQKVAVVWGGQDGAAGKQIVALARALGSKVKVVIPGEQANSRGAAAVGTLPGYLPGFKPLAVARDQAVRLWGKQVPAQPGLSTGAMLQAAVAGRLKALYLVGANLALTWPDGDLVRRALAQAELVIVQDLFLTETAEYAHIVLPAAPFAAKAGHWCNLDGLVQQVARPAMAAGGQAQSDGAIFAALARTLGAPWKGEAELRAELAQWGVALQGGGRLPAAPLDLLDRTPPALDRQEGDGDLVLVPVDRLFTGGGTAAHDPGLARVANRAPALLHPADLERLGLRPGEVVRLSAGDAAIALAVAADRAVVPGTIQVPRGIPSAPANRLGGALKVRVSRAAAEVVA